MRVVVYARVSTEKQGERGSSLVSQSQKFARWCERGGHEIVRSYEERQSATSLVRRRLFTQMLDDLAQTTPQMIVVDSADRFSRNLEDTFDVMKRLRERGINIWPLEWERDDPPDIISYDSPDYLRFREEIIAAQAEAKRIKTRIARSYAARRERGATTTTRPPFGVRRDPNDSDRLAPSADAWVIPEVDAKLLAGERIEDVVAWVRSVAPNGWTSRQGLWLSLMSPAYVAAGVRTPERQAQIARYIAMRKTRFAPKRVYEHEYTGVFACGRCLAAGVPEAEALMGAWNAIRSREGGRRVSSVGCQHTVPAERRIHPPITFVVSRIEPAWEAFLRALSFDEATSERWATGASTTAEVAKRRELERGLARLDQEEATLAARRGLAFDMLGDVDPALISQARRALVEVDRDERKIGPRRDVIRAELSGLTTPPRDAAMLREALRRYHDESRLWSPGERNTGNRWLCDMIGSHPQVSREGRHGWSPVVVRWPVVSEDALADDGLAHRAKAGMHHVSLAQ